MPGFDQSKWPTEANAEYYTKLDEYYKGHLDQRGKDLDDTARPAGERMDHTGQPAAGQADLHVGSPRKLRHRRNVENSQGDNLGEVNDLVLDWNKGDVRYAVLSYGGVLGIGDKLFAVPIDAFHSQPDKSKLVLNVSKDQLKNAPGFDKDQWPNMADPQWTKSVGDFYHQNRSDMPQAD